MSINPITGDKLISKPSTKEYETNWEKIFGNKTCPPQKITKEITNRSNELLLQEVKTKTEHNEIKLVG